MKGTLLDITSEILATVGRHIGVSFDFTSFANVCKHGEQEVSHCDIWWALRSALAYFQSRCRAFPFFREFRGQPEELTSDQVAVCLLEMAVLYNEGNRPESERHEYRHFGSCLGCAHDLTSLLVAFVAALECNDFGLTFGHSERQKHADLLQTIIARASGVLCLTTNQAQTAVEFLAHVGSERKVDAVRFLVERFGQRTTPPTDDELQNAFAAFEAAPPSNAIN